MTPARHSRLQEIFEAAIDLHEPQRSAYLDEACACDPELRVHVKQLMDADTGTESGDETLFVDQPDTVRARLAVLECPECWRCYEAPATACARDGSRLQFAFAGPLLIDGKYLIERRLGRGGMGAVYLAQHVALEKRFALKLILQEAAISPFYRESFENEARALGRLNHPHIVNVTDYGVDARNGGIPYLVMEYLVGRTLSEILKERKVLPFTEAIVLLRATASAVDTAHANGIVHGDLKPSNLFLSEGPGSGPPCLKVVDFGLARLIARSARVEEHGPDVGLGNIRGTPAYMAPELLRAEEATPASDRFAFGALTYELLTGHPPFGRRLSEVAEKIHAPPAGPSSRNPALPGEIDAPVLALLNPDPDARPHSASQAVSAESQAWLGAEQRHWRAREWPKRAALSVGSTLVAVLIAAVLAQLPFARSLEGRLADRRFALAPPRLPDPSLMLVSIDDATLAADPRALADRASDFARMIDAIFASGARALAIDLLLPSGWSESPDFAKAVATHADRLTLALFSSPSGEVVGSECLNRLTAYTLGPRKYAALFGLVNLEEDEDRTIRRARLSYSDKAGGRQESFASRSVEAAFPERRENPSAASPVWIDYSVRLQRVRPISWKDVPARLNSAPRLFHDRLVIAGATFAAANDEHRVPRVTGDALVPGQFVQAWIINTILAGNPVREIGLLPCLAAVGLACLGATAAALCFPHRYVFSFIASVILFYGYPGFAFLLFRSSRTMIDVVAPELAILLSMLAAWGLKRALSSYPVTAP